MDTKHDIPTHTHTHTHTNAQGSSLAADVVDKDLVDDIGPASGPRKVQQASPEIHAPPEKKVRECVRLLNGFVYDQNHRER